MSKQAQLPDGTILEFPDNTPDAIMDQRVKEHLASLRAPDKGTVTVDQAKQAFAGMKTPDDRTASQVRRDQVNAVNQGVADFVTGIPGMIGGMGSAAMDAFNPEGMQRNVDRGMSMIQGLKDTFTPLANDTANLAKSVMGYRSSTPQSTPQQQQDYANFAGQNAAPLLMGIAAEHSPDIYHGIKNMFPSKGAAGAKFAEVMGEAKDIPLNLSAADDAALRGLELGGGSLGGPTSGTGSSMPKVMRDYIRARANNPEMTYEMGRDFQTAAGRLSSTEAQSANPVMKGQVAKLAKALADANREAAVTAGVGPQYDAAMAEYARAARLADMKDALVNVLKRHGAKAAIGTGVGYGVYKALEH